MKYSIWQYILDLKLNWSEKIINLYISYSFCYHIKLKQFSIMRFFGDEMAEIVAALGLLDRLKTMIICKTVQSIIYRIAK